MHILRPHSALPNQYAGKGNWQFSQTFQREILHTKLEKPPFPPDYKSWAPAPVVSEDARVEFFSNFHTSAHKAMENQTFG